MAWLIYNTSTHPTASEVGKIAYSVDGEEGNARRSCDEYQDIIEGEQAQVNSHYVDVSTVTLTAKQALSLSLSKYVVSADGVDQITLSGLPDPFTLDVNGIPENVLGGTFIFTTSTPGFYMITADGPEYFCDDFYIEAE